MKIFVSTGVNTTKGMDTAETSQVIEKCLAGDEQAIERFVSAHKTDVFRLAFSILGEAGDASEVTQQTFIAALKSLGTYRESHPSKPGYSPLQ